MPSFLRPLIPFFVLGLVIVLLAFGLMLLAYLLLFGALVGTILFAVNWVRNKFFASKKEIKREPPKSGRIIDSDDWRKL